jgi:hypothetical protein
MMGIVPPWSLERSIVVRTEEVPNPSLGTDPLERSLADYIKFGLIVVDKQAGGGAWGDPRS